MNALQIQAWTRRRANGQFAYPRSVRAHLEEIRQHAPGLISEEDLVQIGAIQIPKPI